MPLSSARAVRKASLSGGPALNRRAFLAGLCGSAYGQAETAAAQRVQFVSEFSGKLGLFDISRDGALLVVHRRAGSVPCERYPECRDNIHQLQVLRADSRRSVRSVRMVFGRGNFSRWVIAFVPGTHDLLLRGEMRNAPGHQGFMRWNPVTEAKRLLPDPDPRFEFVAFVDGRRVLGTVRTGRDTRRVVWNLDSDQVSEVPGSLDLAADIPLLAALVKTYGGPENVVRRLRPIHAEHIYNAVPTSRGTLLVISGVRASTGDDEHRRYPKFLGVYDLRSGERLRQTQLLADERFVDRTALFGGVKYTDGLVGHLGFQMATSPDGRLVAFSYERYEAANRLLPGLLRREPRFAIYEVDSLTHVGTVSHPKQTISDEGWAAVSPEAGGSLLFSPDGQHLYTTAQATRQWRIQ